MEGLEEVIDIRIDGKVSVDGLIRMMGASGGFTGRKRAEAVDVVESMVRDEGCGRVLWCPACVMVTGARGVVVGRVRNGMVDLISTTCGAVEHSISRT